MILGFKPIEMFTARHIVSCYWYVIKGGLQLCKSSSLKC